MHEQRICHRDIKPSNILITEDNKVFLVDFNVAKLVPITGNDFTQSYTKRPSLLFDTEEVEHLRTQLRNSIQSTSEVAKNLSSNNAVMILKKCTSSEDSDDSDINNFMMHTRTAGTLAFAAPERIKDNCLYT